MMQIFKDNVKLHSLKKHDKLLCKCGSVRYNVEVFEDGSEEENYEDRRWIAITCKKCHQLLFYNGA